MRRPAQRELADHARGISKIERVASSLRRVRSDPYAAGLGGSVRGLFESTNLVSVFDVYSSVDAAIAAMRQENVQTA